MLFGGSDEEDSPLGLIGTIAAIIVAVLLRNCQSVSVSVRERPPNRPAAS